MSYNTLLEFRNNGPLSGSFDDVSDSICEVHLNAAGAKLDSALRVTHVLPLTTPYPEDLKLYERFLAAFTLSACQGVDATQDGKSRFYLIYQDIVAKGGILDQISKGAIRYPDSSTSSTEIRNNIKVYAQRAKRGYTIDDL